jgi:hypothetical protein
VIPVVFAVLGARRGQTVVIALLATLATAGAVAGPAYLRAADDTVVAAQVRTATALERSVQVTAVREDDWKPGNFTASIQQRLTVPTFALVYSAGYDTTVRNGDRTGVPRFVYRDDVCAHVRILAGRCVSGTREVILGRRTAELIGAQAGGQVEFTSARLDAINGWIAGTDWAALTVVGLYEPMDPAEPYWGSRPYFGGIDRGAPEPAFVAQPTMDLVAHEWVTYSADLISGPDTFAPGRIPALRQDLADLELRMRQTRDFVGTDMFALITRIEADRRLLTEVVPVAAVPLILLCWFVIYLAMAAATEQRRPEFGLLALRGTPLGHRFALALGPTVVPILVGAPIGYLLGYPGVAIFARATLPGTGPSPMTPADLRYAALALAGALIAGAWGQRRLFRSGVGPLFRSVPPRVRAAGSLTAALIAATLAVVAVTQLRASGGQLAGVSLLGPVLVTLAVALAVAQLVVPVSRGAGRRALLRGRIGPALAALRLARRAGAQRLLAFVVVAVALLGFATIAASVGDAARTERARIEIGAPEAVPVAPLPASVLLAATRRADPDGRWAMAVVTSDDPQDPVPPVLAVDSGRLAAVTTWPEAAGMSAHAAAARLRPIAADPIVVDGGSITLDVTAETLDSKAPVQVRANLMPLDGRPVQRIPLGVLQPGENTRTAQVTGCPCRLASLEVVQAGQMEFEARLVLRRVTQAAPNRVLADAGQFAGWVAARQSTGTDVLGTSLSAHGMTVSITASETGRIDGRVLPPDAPYPLPVLAAGTPPESVRGLDDRGQPARVVATSPVLPRVARSGTLVDLGYLDRIARDVGAAQNAEVWLGRRAPADAVERLRAAGLVPGRGRSLERAVTGLRAQGPAVALRFHVATGVLALLLAAGALLLVAAIDRTDRAAESRTLRIQGLRRRDTAIYARRGYLWVVAVAVVTGVVAAVIAWVGVGPYMPQFADRPPDGAVQWPGPAALVIPALAAGVVLVLAVFAAAAEPVSPGPDSDRRA